MEDPPGPREFATTHWSLVGAAGTDEASQGRAREALEELCRAYWYPLYAFVRSRGHSANDAQDLTQAFFARIIETGGFASADRELGRFRSYLLGAMKHFLFDREWALETIAGALQALRNEMEGAGKSEQFDALKGCLTGEDGPPREEIAAQLEMSEGAVKVAVHRLRQRYRKLLRAAIAVTVSNEANLDDEMRYLLAVLRRR
jgi:hypothetical protein